MSPPFEDRTDAGHQLADRIAAAGVAPDVVLAIPRGGLPLGRAVADRLEVPLDVVVARKIGAPGNPELAIGAVGSDGTRWLNDRLIADLGVDANYVDRMSEEEAGNARTKAERYVGDRPRRDLTGKRVVVVDDGVATGATMTACARLVRARGAHHVVIAAPVGSPETVEELRSEADDVIVLETPAFFHAVGQFYDRFDQVTDEEAISYLEQEG